MRVFQRALFNTNKDLCDIREMYFRTDSSENFSDNFLLKKGQFFETSTYFNSLSVEKIKKYTNISDVSLQIEFKGSLNLSFFHVNNNMQSIKLFESNFYNVERSTQTIALDAWNGVETGLIYFRVDANDDVELFDFCYSTSTPESQKVKLAIVITHFNRQNYLLPALRRIQADIFNNNENINVIVSDNSQNLDFENTDRIKIYKNKNYGGSGGFTFGLLKAIEQGYTHCLFMDDDASTESECILRTYDILSFTTVEKIAISGSMLYERETNILHESGARIKKGIEAINCGLDLKELNNLVTNEIHQEVEYGGWWFFAFSLSDVDVLPYPFFVKGDDMCFSVSNNFKILTINGICSWQEDFLVKHNSFSQYLSSRSWAALNLLSIDKRGVLGFLNLYISDVVRGLLINQYDLSRVALLAYRDLVFDSNLWVSNMDMIDKRKQINRIVKYEKYLPKDMDFSGIEINYGRKKIVQESLARRFLRVLTFNGFLIPSFFFSKETLVIPKNYFRFSEVFLKKNILFFDPCNNTAFEARHNKISILNLLICSFLMLFILFFSYPFLRKSYAKKYYNLTKKEFWLDVLR
ncbi:glycosyltransferase [Acinetobacter junii]|uniref:glycosyltransferase n=1 Tax=Acinetobacter junii TaxID=40215 RepID=UPI001F226F0E|nr:glycosyltransferase [Acinetobacter junii]